MHSVSHCRSFLLPPSESSADDASALENTIASSLTVSYIPLSHSSDRYKVWQHVALGGRVAFVYFAVENWSEHETSKKDQMLE